MRKFTSLLALVICFFVGFSAQAQESAKKVIGEIGDAIVSTEELENGGTYLITSIGRHNTDGQYMYESISSDGSHYFLFEAVAEGHDANAAIIIEVIDENHIYLKSQTGYYVPPYKDPRGKFALSNIEKEPLLIEPIDGADGQFTLAYTSYTGGSSAYPGASVIYLDADAANLSNWSDISSAGGNGAFRICPVTLVDPTASMYMDEVLARIQFDGTAYPADVPGGYPQQLIDDCQEAYDYAVDIQLDYEAYTDDEIMEAAQALEAAYEALLNGQIKVTFQAGNYYLVSARIGTSNNLLENASDLTAVDAAYGAAAGALWSESFNATVFGADADPRYIWQVENAGTNDASEPLFTIKNLAMGQFVNSVTGTSASYGFTANAEEAGKFKVGTSSSVAGFVTFVNNAITNEYGALHAAVSGKKVVNWTASSGGSAWYVVPVDDQTIAAMGAKIDSIRAAAAQQALNDTLQKYYTAATAAREAGRTWIFDGTNDGKFTTGDGLVTDASQIWVYPADPSENNTPGLLDGVFDGTSFAHTSWHSSTPGTERHFIQLDLGEAVETLVLKYAVRSNAGTPDIPYEVIMYGTNDAAKAVHTVGKEGEDGYTPADTIPSTEWDNLGEYTLNWQYPLLNSEGQTIDVAMRNNIRSLISTGEGSGVTTFEFPGAYRYVRMAVKESVQSKKNGAPRSNGGDNFTYWCLSELRAYAGEYDPDCVYAHMDQDAINALESSLVVAKDELANEHATQTTIDNLKAAYEAFMAVFPDKNKLQAAIDEAKTWMENAVEGDQIGNYESGAKNGLNSVISDAQSVADGTLTYGNYNQAMTSLETALQQFASKLVLPQTGYYNIQSLSKGGSKEGFVVARSTSTTTNRANAALVWKYPGESMAERLNAQWYVEKTDLGYTFKNVATGYYMQNTQEDLSGAIALGENPCEIKLRAARDSAGIGLNFIINEEEGFFANTDPAGPFVVWNSAKGNDNSAFLLLDAGMPETTLTIDLDKPVSIHTLPFDIMQPTDPIYGVAGITTDGQRLALNKIMSESQTIAGGTPFVVIADTSVVKSLVVFAVEEDPANIAYVRNALDVKGLVGTLQPDTVDAKALVMNTTCTQLIYAGDASYQKIAANSGYFVWTELQALPTVDAGDEEIPLLEALVNGLDNVVAEPVALRRQGVYTLQGQKVTDVRNLPAGVYIVNGRKVLVK